MATTLYHTEDLCVRRVFYSGTEALKKGYLVCWDRDNNDPYAPTGPGATQFGAAQRNPNRHRVVEKPASGNLHNFAGIVVRDYAASPSGREIEIFVPVNDQVLDVWTSVNCTQSLTALCVQPNSFTAGPIGTGIVIASAVQTVDRSTTPGPVQAVVRMPDRMEYAYGTNIASPSAAIWETCPADFIARDFGWGSIIEDDFDQQPVVASAASADVTGAWWMYEIFLKTTTGYLTSDGLIGGAIRLGSSADNQSAVIGPGPAPFRIHNTMAGPLWFEARIKRSTVSNGLGNAFVGLAGEGAAADGVPITYSDAVAQAPLIGFAQLAAAGNTFDAWHATASTTPAKITNTSFAVGAGTWYRLGFVFRPGVGITFYREGVALSGTVAATTINGSTFPNGSLLGPCLGFMGASTTDNHLAVDWVRVAQLRHGVQ